ncbi:MAG: hypothetical protein KHY83_07480 [Coriobacteriia bacterium]|nr:hypothetical protein [Coriobacteriia bacterium]MBS5478487.1 hypothetical protein [Coriobacteriia bacterium]
MDINQQGETIVRMAQAVQEAQEAFEEAQNAYQAKVAAIASGCAAHGLDGWALDITPTEKSFDRLVETSAYLPVGGSDWQIHVDFRNGDDFSLALYTSSSVLPVWQPLFAAGLYADDDPSEIGGVVARMQDGVRVASLLFDTMVRRGFSNVGAGSNSPGFSGALLLAHSYVCDITYSEDAGYQLGLIMNAWQGLKHTEAEAKHLLHVGEQLVPAAVEQAMAHHPGVSLEQDGEESRTRVDETGTSISVPFPTFTATDPEEAAEFLKELATAHDALLCAEIPAGK